MYFLDSGYGSRSVPCSTISKEASFCSRWEELQSSTARQYERVRELGPLSLRLDVCIKSLTSELREPQGEVKRVNSI